MGGLAVAGDLHVSLNLLCALCLPTRDVPEPAVTVIAGYATCDEHADYIHDEEFAWLARIVAANTPFEKRKHA